MTPADRDARAVQAVADGVAAWNCEQSVKGLKRGRWELFVPLSCRVKIARAVLAAVDGDEHLQRVEPYPRPYPWGPAGDSDAGSGGQGTGGNASETPVNGP